jgi:hypothetical protein
MSIAVDDSDDEDGIPDSEKIYVLLDMASLEVGKTKGRLCCSFFPFHLISCPFSYVDGIFKLLDCDQTALLRKNHLNPADYRPDIAHKEFVAPTWFAHHLLDSCFLLVSVF